MFAIIIINTMFRLLSDFQREVHESILCTYIEGKKVVIVYNYLK